jgi:hypothetical protein
MRIVKKLLIEIKFAAGLVLVFFARPSFFFFDKTKNRIEIFEFISAVTSTSA